MIYKFGYTLFHNNHTNFHYMFINLLRNLFLCKLTLIKSLLVDLHHFRTYKNPSYDLMFIEKCNFIVLRNFEF